MNEPLPLSRRAFLCQTGTAVAVATGATTQHRSAAIRLCQAVSNDEKNANSTIETTVLDPADPMLPDGYRLAAYLDCGGPSRQSDASGPRIELLKGEPYAFPGVSGPIGTCVHDADEVVVALRGLNPGAEYVLGFTWWDADNSGRRQLVRFGSGTTPTWTTVLPPTCACAFHKDQPTWARVLLPVVGAFAGLEQIQAAFVRDGGPNAVVNEIWLLEKADKSVRKRVLIVTGDDYAGHLWRQTGPELAAILRVDTRLEVSICESPAIYGSPLLGHYDATVLHFKNYSERLALGKEIWTGLAGHIGAGHGLVIVHFGCGAFQEWDEFVNVAGRIWNPQKRGHDPYGAFQVRITDTTHPVTAGLPDFPTEDELYTCLDGQAPIHVLCQATSVVDHLDYPMAFVVGDSGGRVFHCTLGHDTRALGAAGARTLYARAAAWAAGLEPAQR